MTIQEAENQLAIETDILRLLQRLPQNTALFYRISFQIERISSLQNFIIATTLAKDSANPRLEPEPNLQSPGPPLPFR
jgi:hypothetical protein